MWLSIDINKEVSVAATTKKRAERILLGVPFPPDSCSCGGVLPRLQQRWLSKPSPRPARQRSRPCPLRLLGGASGVAAAPPLWQWCPENPRVRPWRSWCLGESLWRLVRVAAAGRRRQVGRLLALESWVSAAEVLRSGEGGGTAPRGLARRAALRSCRYHCLCYCALNLLD